MLVTAVRKEKPNTTATLGASKSTRKKEKEMVVAPFSVPRIHHSGMQLQFKETENPHYLHFQDSYDTITILSSYKEEFFWP